MRYWLNRLGVSIGLKPILIMDIDSTIAPFIPMFVVAAKEALGLDIDPLPRTFMAPFDGLTRDEISACFEVCNTPDFIKLHQIPFENAAETLQHLSTRFEIRYITDRPDSAWNLTHDWLAEHGIPHANRLYTCNGDKKQEVCRLRGRAWGIIDDKPSTMVWSHYEARIPHVLAIRNSTNWNLEDLPFVHLSDNWHELEQELLSRLG